MPRLRVTWHRPARRRSGPSGVPPQRAARLAWTYADEWSGGDPAQSHFDVKVATDSTCSSVLTDGASGIVASADTAWTFPDSVALTDFTTYYWCVRVKDGSGWSSWTSASFVWDQNALTADIAEPVDGGATGGLASITGTAAGTGFASYTLQYQATCAPNGTLVDIGTNPYTTPVSGDLLGTWDTDDPERGRLPRSSSPCPPRRRRSSTRPASASTTPPPPPRSRRRPCPARRRHRGHGRRRGLRGLRRRGRPRPDATSDWQALALDPDSGPVATTGKLAAWDTVKPYLAPGLQGFWTIRLTVTDRAANATVVEQDVFIENSGRGLTDSTERLAFDLAGGWSATVALASGEGIVARGLFTIPSYGPPQRLALAYSSLAGADPDGDSGFGQGWVSNVTQSLTIDDELVVWNAPDGAIVPFGLVDSTWRTLESRFESLTHQVGAETFTIEQTDGGQLVFEDSGDGRLLRIEDRFGEALELDWSASSATATDDSGRSTSLDIDANDHITAATDFGRSRMGLRLPGRHARGCDRPRRSRDELLLHRWGPHERDPDAHA